MHGKLVYSRNILIPEGRESKEALLGLFQTKKVALLDDALGISNLPFKMTPALMLRCAYWAQNQCFYQAADVMRNTYGLEINNDTIRMVTNYVGKAVFEEDYRQAGAAIERLDTGKEVYKNGKKGRVSNLVDNSVKLNSDNAR